MLIVINQHCYITGGSTGLGLALAILLTKRGADVSVVARNEENLKKALAQLEVINLSNSYSNQLTGTSSCDRLLESTLTRSCNHTHTLWTHKKRRLMRWKLPVCHTLANPPTRCSYVLARQHPDSSSNKPKSLCEMAWIIHIGLLRGLLWFVVMFSLRET